jgi:translation elongation factor P/translation initiation factor 5A
VRGIGKLVANEMIQIISIAVKIIICTTILFTLTCCDETEEIRVYKIEAQFYAPLSELRALVKTHGEIEFFADAGTGKSAVKVELKDSLNQLTQITLITSNENIDSVYVKDKKHALNCKQFNRENFYQFMDSVGFHNLDKNEMNELCDAITLINQGPKIGFSDGQTKFITIEKQIINWK